AYVGTVHALAHSLGGKYNVPHGLANAVILPKVLKAFGKKAVKKLAILADSIGIGENNSPSIKAKLFIEEIENMNKRMGITNTFGNLIKDEDLDFLVNHAYKEGVPLYPTPRILSKSELRDIYIELQQGK
ncbi:MAG: iron-containing alcohol dehydrogenase, partial [Bacilli bacterium]|nr:iron-containing alcohol dehydrogenase [Bacilli bacterium]